MKSKKERTLYLGCTTATLTVYGGRFGLLLTVYIYGSSDQFALIIGDHIVAVIDIKSVVMFLLVLMLVMYSKQLVYLLSCDPLIKKPINSLYVRF